MNYHFGVPGYVIWILHIIVGLFLSYVGYEITYKRKINHNIGLLVLIIGVLVLLYHAHIWLNHTLNKHKEHQES